MLFRSYPKFCVGMPVVRTDGRAGGHVITKFSRMGSLPHFVTHGAPLRASRARAPLKSVDEDLASCKRWISRKEI